MLRPRRRDALDDVAESIVDGDGYRVQVAGLAVVVAAVDAVEVRLAVAVADDGSGPGMMASARGRGWAGYARTDPR